MKIDLKKITVWTAIITPLFENGAIDFDSLGGLLKKQEAAKNGVVLLGSTGEGLALSRAEKEAVVRFACELNLSIPYLVGVPGHDLDAALEWVQFAKQQAIDGFLCVTPYYAKPGAIGQTKWFEKILAAADKPVMLYNVPSRTGVSLHPDVLRNLKGNRNLWALKESSGSVEKFSEYKKLNTDLSYFCGDDGLMPEFSKAGAVGLVSVASNVWPEATHRVAQLCLSKEFDAFAKMWLECTDTLFLASNPIPAKWLHFDRGEIKTALTRPPLDATDFKVTEPLKLADLRVQDWMKK